MRRPNELPNGRPVIMPNTTGRKSCTAWHIPNDTVFHLEQSLSAAGVPTVCTPVCPSRHCFMATSLRTPLTICHRVFSKSTIGARSLFMNWSTNCLSLGSRSMNHSTPFLPLSSRPPPEESLHLMSVPVQADHLPICLGKITTRTNSECRSPNGADKYN